MSGPPDNPMDSWKYPAGDDPRPGDPASPPFVPAAGAIPVPGYILERRLGRGGFGEVWRAMGPGGVSVALKFVSLEEGFGKAELRALDLMKKIQHPHLTGLSGIWVQQDLLILAMELGDRTLMDCLNDALARGQKGIAADDLHEYMREAAKGIDHLNSLQIMHRDVKPKNLLLMGGSVKVSDFGLAKILEKNLTTTTGAFTAAYAAPEFVENQASRQSDQYSLAVTYCHLRGGRLPFVGSAMQLMAAHLNAEPDLSMLPEEERPAVLRALSKAPGDRWPDCRSFVRALVGSSGADSFPHPPTGRPSKRRPRVAAIASVVALLGLGIILVAGYRYLADRPTTGLSASEVERIVREVSIYSQSRPEPFREHAADYQIAKEIEVSSNPDYEILSDDRVIDLRDWKLVPADRSRDLFAPVMMTKRIRLIKVKPARTVEFQGRTSGLELFTRCLDAYPSREIGRDFEDYVGPERMRVRKLVIDVSSVPVGQQFDLMLGSCYWNSLQMEQDQWFGVMGYKRSYKVSQLLLFPPGKPFKEYSLKVAKTTKSEATDFDGEKFLVVGPGKDWIYWEVPKPNQGSVYQLHWKW